MFTSALTATEPLGAGFRAFVAADLAASVTVNISNESKSSSATGVKATSL